MQTEVNSSKVVTTVESVSVINVRSLDVVLYNVNAVTYGTVMYVVKLLKKLWCYLVLLNVFISFVLLVRVKFLKLLTEESVNTLLPSLRKTFYQL